MSTPTEHVPAIDAAVDRLARLPPAVEKILSFAMHEGSTARHLAQICESSPDLSARILKLANSPTLGCRQPVGQLLQAAVILGMSRIRNLALSVHLAEKFTPRATPIDVPRFWRHSFAAAAMARWIGIASGSRQVEDMYLAGLLHDLGAFVLADSMPAEYERVLADARASGRPLEELEEEALGITHAEAGFLLASRWPLEARVLDAVRWHPLAPERFPTAAAPHSSEIATSLALAERVCRHHGWGFACEREEFPEAFAPPGGFPQSRTELLELFGAASLASGGSGGSPELPAGSPDLSGTAEIPLA